MQSASIYKEVYQAEIGELLDTLPEAISLVTFPQVTIYRENQLPRWIDIDGKRYQMKLIAENESIDLD